MSFSNIQWAEAVIARTYSDKVSVDRKAKGLAVFGENSDVDKTGVEMIWANDGVEILLSSNGIDTVSSSSTSDTSIISIEGHTIDGNGDFTFVVQTAILNGRNKVILTTPLARVGKVENINGIEFDGDVYCYEDTAITNGVPSDKSKIHAKATVGSETSLKCASTISKDEYLIATGMSMSVQRTKVTTVDFKLQVKKKGGVFITQFPFTLNSSGSAIHVPFDPPYIIPKNADFRVICESSANNTHVDAVVFGYLATII